MPSINFPSGPSLNDTYNLGTRTWKWNGEAWALQPLTGGFTGSQGYSGSKGTLEAASDNTLNDDTKVIFGDAGEHIYGDGTDLKIVSSGEVHITAGRVGIGTDNPNKQFHLAASTVDIPLLRLETTDGGNKRLDLRVESSNGIIGANQSAQDLIFETTGSERVRIKHDGKVGIGVTNPASMLSVVSPDTAALTTVLQLDNPNAAGKGVDMEFTQNTNVKHRIKSYYDATNQWTLGIDTEDTADAFNIVDNGNVGIGTSTPQGRISVLADDSIATPTMVFQAVTGNDLAHASISTMDDSGGVDVMLGSNIYIGINGTTQRFNTGRSGSSVRFGYTGTTKFYAGISNNVPTEVVRISNVGNVGIGTTTPAEKLDVTGNVKITGALTLSSGVSNSTSITIKNSSGTALKTMYGTTS